ncbi:MAG TPA: sigma-70 family RNA polymerase sigma factor [Gemmataceae bacterium]|nr:sigma-70 family RNA polymerase sigma factor [Gemmataceae bacterium]
MIHGRLSPILRHLRRVIPPREANGISDAQLLERFVHQNDEAAFELLLWRHGPMVWTLCRRILPDFHEAEDAFQAAMLVLARKAGSINKRLSLASWLYKVAFRIALRARADSARRAKLEKRNLTLPPQVFVPDLGNDVRELRPVIDEGLMQMPEKYRAPVVLCYLQNKSNEEAARLLRWPVGTVKTRLAKARELLGSWLRRRGVVLSTAALASILMPPTSQAAMPAGILSATLKSAMPVSAGSLGAAAISARAFFLMEGTMKAMFWTKIKIVAAVVLFAGVAGSGAGWFSYQTRGADGDGQPSAVTQHPTPTVPPKKVQPPPTEDELRAAQSDLLLRENDLKEAESLLERAKARLQVGKLRIEELQKKLPAKPPVDPKQPVAFIFDMPITRQELADYLIAQYGADKIELLVNKLIIERACREKCITVSDAEIDAAMKEDMKSMACSGRDEFERQIKNTYHHSLQEWREDVIKTRLCMSKLARLKVSVSEEDIRNAFEGAFGERAICDIILWPRGQEEAAKTAYTVIRDHPEEFDRFARQQLNSSLAAHLGRIEPFGRHTTGEEIFEKEAFALKPGGMSLVETKEGTAIIKCYGRFRPEKDVKLEDVRAKLTEQVLDKKTQQEIPKLFEELRKRAQPRLLLKK